MEYTNGDLQDPIAFLKKSFPPGTPMKTSGRSKAVDGSEVFITGGSGLLLRPNTGPNSTGMLKVTATLNVSVRSGVHSGLKFPYCTEFVQCPHTVQSGILRMVDILHKQQLYENLPIEQVIIHTIVTFNKWGKLTLAELNPLKTVFAPLICFNRAAAPVGGTVLMLNGSVTTESLALNGLNLHLRGKKVTTVALGIKGAYPLFGEVYKTIEEAIAVTLEKVVEGPIKESSVSGLRTVLPQLSQHNQLVMYRAFWSLANEYANHAGVSHKIPFPKDLTTPFWSEFQPKGKDDDIEMA